MASFCLKLETRGYKNLLTFFNRTNLTGNNEAKIRKLWKQREIYSCLHILFYFLAMRGCF